MAAAMIEETVCEDMISALPEDLLVAILSLLPIKDAVATMILSKRWRFVWTMLPRLEYEENGDGSDCSFDDDEDSCSFDDDEDSCSFDDGDIGDDDDNSKKSIWWFFEKSMELHKAPVLKILFIKLGPACPVDADVGKSLIKAVERRVAVIKFKLCWSTGPTRLPKSLYSCETLYQLTLSHKILVDFPSSSCLPSLIYLELFYVVYEDEASLVRFLSSCPLLENLFVKRNKNHDNVTRFSVKVPSLRYLYYCASDDDVVDTAGRLLVIDTPALIYLDIIDYSRESWSIENMHCLEAAFINVEPSPDIDKSITSFSSRVLSLVLYIVTGEVLVRYSTINFSALTDLQISPQDSDWLKPLLLLLKNAPKVKDLLVNNTPTSSEYPIPLSWNQPSFVPECISSQLEIFEYTDYGDGGEQEEEFLTYILANSKCLKTVTISVRPSFDLEKRELIIEKLRNIPRVSTTSKLLLK